MFFLAVLFLTLAVWCGLFAVGWGSNALILACLCFACAATICGVLSW
jgi:hypothetical protein